MHSPTPPGIAPQTAGADMMERKRGGPAIRPVTARRPRFTAGLHESLCLAACQWWASGVSCGRPPLPSTPGP